MVFEALGLFLLEAGAGTALLLLFFPPRAVGRGFLILHGALAFGFLLAACLVRPTGLPFPLACVATGLFGSYVLISLWEPSIAGWPTLASGAALSVWAMARVALLAPRGNAWTVSGAMAGSLLFGAVVLTMNLGHWYLVSRSLPRRLLTRGAVFFAGLVTGRTLLLVLALAADRSARGREALFRPEEDALFFLFRIAWGIVGPVALSYFIWKTAEMKSNQAATGLLYVALVFVLIGELLSSYLTVSTGFPA